MNDNTLHSEKQEEQFLESEFRAAELEKQFQEQVKIKCPGVYAPLPLQREATPAKPFPFDALGSVLGEAAMRIHEVVQAPDATCGQSVLAALSLACQGFVDVHNDGRTSPTSLFMLTISESGERKSATDKIALKPIFDWQMMLVQQHKKQLTEYKNKCDVWKLRRAAAIKEASENVGGLLNLEPEPQAPCEGLILCEEPTLEGLEQLLERGQPSAGVFSDEGGRLVGGHAMNADNALKTACGLSNLWDGKSLTRVRKSEGSKILSGRRLALHLMIQPIVLVQLLNNEVLMGQGLFSRCLLAAPMPIAGTRKYKAVDLSKEPAITAYYDLINKILDRPYPKKDNDQQNDGAFNPADSLDPALISLNEEAKIRWIEFHDNTDRKMAEDGEFYPIKPFASKASEQVIRIAALLTFSENLSKPIEEVKIELQHLNRAIILVEYYLTEALRILGRTTGDPNISLATVTLEWIKRNRRDQIFPLADIYQRGPPQIRNGSKAKKIMQILEEHGHVISIRDVVIDGRNVRSAWRLVVDKETR